MVPEVGLGRESHDCQSCFRFFNKSRQEKRRLTTQKHSGDISCLDRTDILQALVKLFQQLVECNGGAREPLLGILKRIEVGRHLQWPWACCGSFSRWAGTIYPRSKQVVAFLVLNCPLPLFRGSAIATRRSVALTLGGKRKCFGLFVCLVACVLNVWVILIIGSPVLVKASIVYISPTLGDLKG